MKKSINILFLCIGIIFLSGCSKEKKLECSQTIDNASFGKQEVVHNISFKDDKITKQITITKTTISKEMEEFKQDFYNSIKDSMDEINKQNGIETSVTLDQNVIEEKIVVNPNKLDDTAKNTIGFDENDTYDSLKQSFIDNQYECK